MRKNKCIYDYQLLEGEELKQIEDFPRYMVSNMGRVFSYTNPEKPKLLRAGVDGGGYPQVTLIKDGKKYSKKVSRIVAEAFIPNPDNKPQVDHINTVKTDSRACNLRWATASENALNNITYVNRCKRMQALAIERSYTVYAYSKDFEMVSAFTSTSSAAKTMNYSQGNICSCCQGSLPTYKNLIWSYDPELTPEKREELLEQGKEKFIRNRLSTYSAVEKYRKNPENVEKANKKALEWYYNHKQYIKEKRHRQYEERKNKRRKEGATQDVL